MRPRTPASLALVPAAPVPRRDVLVEVAEEVFFEVFGLVSALSPLQGPWLQLGPGQVGSALETVLTWRRRPGESPAKVLRARWPELVPGHRALGCLARLMVDRIVG